MTQFFAGFAALVAFGGLALFLLIRYRDAFLPVRLEPDAAARAGVQLARLRRQNRWLALGVVIGVLGSCAASTASAWWLIGGVAATVAAALAAIAIQPDPGRFSGVTPAGPRAADLKRRSPRSFGPAWAFALPLALAGALIVFLVAAGVASAQGGTRTAGRAIEVVGDNWTLLAGPFPGWRYGGPMIALAIVLIALMALALVRVARFPQRSERALAAAETAARQTRSRLAMKLTSFALASYLGGAAQVAGWALGNLNAITDGPTTGDWGLTPDDLDGLSALMQAGGLVVSVLGVLLLVAAIVDACADPRITLGGRRSMGSDGGTRPGDGPATSRRGTEPS